MYCRIPFERIEIVPDGDVFNCCPSWLHKPIGNIFTEPDFDRIWNSKTAQILRSSMLEETYEFCNHEYCSFLLNGDFTPLKNKNETHRSTGGFQETILSDGPAIMALNYDPTCNMYCKSCRGRMITLSKEKMEFLLKFQENLLKTSLFQNVRELIVTGNGDPFASKIHMTLLQDINEQRFPRLGITLRTNGILFTPENWGKISTSHYAIDLIKVSIDAAAKETYRNVRHGGDFDKLLKNLSFMAGLKQTKILKLQAVFLVQQENYREMPMFVELMESFNFDSVHFAKINNWGTYTEEEFRQAAIHRKDHPERENFLEILRNPILQIPQKSVQKKQGFETLSSKEESSGAVQGGLGRRPILKNPIVSSDFSEGE
jgi:MoaA/NifB/PqqE/SkfB family radical SAM enzyme